MKLNNLIETRKIKHLTQDEISSYLNCDRSTYSYIENGKILITIDTVLKLCYLFDCDILYLLDIRRNYKPLGKEDRELIKKKYNL